ncbi:hypothetical protein L1887_14744 [Cichorium endivia]|nr:hypothetical protein L1887_14744 [Cichorium endivia]
MTRVDDIPNPNAAGDGKLQGHNQNPESSQQSTPPSSSEQVFVPETQEGIAVHALPQIVIQPQFFIQQPVGYHPPPAPAPAPPPNQGPAFQPPIQAPVGQHFSPGFQPYYPPEPPQLPLPNRQGWSTGLFDCMNDPENAIITLFCPCVTFGQLAATIDNGGTSCETSGMIYTVVALIIGFPCIVSCNYRTKLRGRFGLVEEPANDCMTHLCCECCALCQEYRELNHRGFNPSAGKSVGV